MRGIVETPEGWRIVSECEMCGEDLISESGTKRFCDGCKKERDNESKRRYAVQERDVHTGQYKAPTGPPAFE